MTHRIASLVLPLAFVIAQDSCSDDFPVEPVELRVENAYEDQRVYLVIERGQVSSMEDVLAESGMAAVLPGETTRQAFSEAEPNQDGPGGCMTTGQMWVVRSISGKSYESSEPVSSDELIDLELLLHIGPGFCTNEDETRLVLPSG